MLTDNLFSTTATLQRLLRFNMERLRGAVPTLNITAIPPEKVSGLNTVNLFLYHAMEDAQMRNHSLGEVGRQTETGPLVLTLYYILTAHHMIEDSLESDPAEQQFLLGLALKTFHDYSIITDETRFDRGGAEPESVVPADLLGRGTRLDIAMRPVTPEDAVNFWSAESSATVRLAGYFEVRSVFLEPEDVSHFAAPVIDLGLFAAPISPIVIHALEGVMRFEPPSSLGLGPQSVVTRPARALLTGDPSPSDADLTITGAGFGREGRIVLRHAAWPGDAPAPREVEIDPALNPDWALRITAARISLRAAPSIMVDEPGGPVPLPIFPGHYQLSIRQRVSRFGPGGTTHESTLESNRTDLAIGARISGDDPAGADGKATLRIEPLFDIFSEAVSFALSIDRIAYGEVDALDPNPAADAGLFERHADGLQFRPLFDPATSEPHAVRLIVNGVESQPYWITP